MAPSIAGTLRQSGYLRGLARKEFASRAADVLVAINGVHPFRERNGRTQRVFVRELARKAGHELDFSVVTRERMIQASIAGNDNNNNPGMMRRLFNEIADPARVAALDKAIEALDRLKFPWNDNYVATAEPGHQVEVTMAGIAGEQFMARTTTAVLIGQSSDLLEPRPARGEIFTFDPTPWKRRRR